MSLIQVDKTEYFEKWFRKLKDHQTKIIITPHIKRMEMDNLGVVRSVG